MLASEQNELLGPVHSILTSPIDSLIRVYVDHSSSSGYLFYLSYQPCRRPFPHFSLPSTNPNAASPSALHLQRRTAGESEPLPNCTPFKSIIHQFNSATYPSNTNSNNPTFPISRDLIRFQINQRVRTTFQSSCRLLLQTSTQTPQPLQCSETILLLNSIKSKDSLPTVLHLSPSNPNSNTTTSPTFRNHTPARFNQRARKTFQRITYITKPCYNVEMPGRAPAKKPDAMEFLT
jgi:hypothetical protein